MHVSFIVVTFNTRDLLRRCLTSIASECSLLGMRPDVVVVDNASSDGTVDMVESEFPGVRLVANSENLGPARGFNQGLVEVLPRADVVLLMNSDIELLPGTLGRMVSFMSTHPGVDGVSGSLYRPGMVRRRTRDHIVRVVPLDKSRPFREDFPGTVFAMIRAAAFQKVGGYDENFYFYNEDLDWAERAKRLGCVFYHLPDAGAIHIGGQGRKHNTPGILAELYRGNVYYFRRHHPALAWAVAIVLLADTLLRRLLLLGMAAGSGAGGTRAATLAAAYREAGRRMLAEWMRPSSPRIPHLPALRPVSHDGPTDEHGRT